MTRENLGKRCFTTAPWQILFQLILVLYYPYTLLNHIKFLEQAMLVTSTPSIEKKQIDSYLGIVMGSTVRARHLGTDILATLKNIVGGELKSYSILLMQARKEAMERMVSNAEEMGADAVVNFRYETSTIAAAASEVIAYGTAVNLKINSIKVFGERHSGTNAIGYFYK
jgi:uncharacterized protein YbjQ (UPF0145 family)